MVHQWLANWENQNGEVVTYGFRYQYESRNTNDVMKANALRNLTVVAVFMPAPLAKQIREQVKEFSKKSNRAKKNSSFKLLDDL